MPGSTTRPAERVRRLVRWPAVLAFWLVVWQLVAQVVGQELLVPSPLAVAGTLGRLASTTGFWFTTGVSLLRIGLGFLAGVVVGCCAAVATTQSRTADALLAPALRVVRAAPVASFVILALVWLPTGRLPAFIAFLMVVPIVWDGVAAGLRHQDPALLEMAAVFRFGTWQTLRRVRVPGVAPFFVTACTTGMGLAWKSGIAAEVIARPEASIGRELQDAKVYLDTPSVFAWTITAVALSLALEWALRRATARWALPQRETGRRGSDSDAEA